MDPTLSRPRPVYRNIHITQIATYRLPLAGLVSILHRISGALLFVLLPFVVWLFDQSVTSQVSYDRMMAVFAAGAGPLPGWLLKLVVLGLIWAYLHHFIAGIRHLRMDISHHAVDLLPGRRSAIFTLAASLALTVALGIKLFF
ncbi:MAG: succinate dehydrogenase, cytochrome b556 subunit [Betaproteobacteria bacterium]